MEKINIGGELNPLYGRVASAEHIYDYTNLDSQDRINSRILNELLSFSLNLSVSSLLNGIEVDLDVVEYEEGKTSPFSINWDIKRKDNSSFEINSEDKPISLRTDNENSVINQQFEQVTKGKTSLNASKGETVITMTFEIGGFSASESKSVWVVPPIYYGFSDQIKLNSISSFQKKVAISPEGKYTLKNENKNENNEVIPSYFYICIPETLGVQQGIDVFSSGIKVPFEKYDDLTVGTEVYHCWRNPNDSLIKGHKEVIYNVKIKED